MWSLKYSGEDYRFDRVSVTSLQVEGLVYRVDDTPNPRSDGVFFGQDFADPGDVKLRILINFSTVRNVAMQREMLREAATRFINAWDAAAVRAVPGKVGELTIPELGMFEGRPRRAEIDWSTFGLGYLEGTAAFIRSTLSVYSVDEGGNSAWFEKTVGLVPPQQGGIIAPIIAPVSTTYESDRSLPFTVGGTAPAWPIIRVKGPINTGAQVELVNQWSLKLIRALAWDETAEIDTRPGRRSSKVNGRALNVMSPTTDFSKLNLTPGVQEVGLRGTSLEGTAKVTLRWRETRGTI